MRLRVRIFHMERGTQVVRAWVQKLQTVRAEVPILTYSLAAASPAPGVVFAARVGE